MAVDREARIAAIGVAYEAANIPNDVFGAAVGWTAKTVEREAARRGWRKASGSRAELARRTRGLIERRLDAIDARLAAGQKLSVVAEKALGDEALKIHNALNAAGPAARNEEDSAKERMDADEQLTDVLCRIDRRIVELAERHASELVARQRACGAGGGDAGGVADASDGSSARDEPAA